MEESMKVSDRLIQALPQLDTLAKPFEKLAEPFVGPHSPRELKDFLVGVWFGHPLHPAVVQAPIGFWMSSLLLDLAGEERAADLMMGAGLLASPAAALTGLAQWYDTTYDEAPRRLGTLHALVNTAAIGIYGASLLARQRGDRDTGYALSMLGMGVVTAGAFFGGDLAYDLGIGVSNIAFEQPSTEWTDVLAEGELPDGKPIRVDAAGVPVMLLRRGQEIAAITATCPHLSGPLDEGKIDGDQVTCPWHGSVFNVCDGSVIHGPATSPAVPYEVRIQNGRVEVRARAER
jgi:nitrite reductase/ring-hydroxylating ferredoxin subunit/uncharacterized membrane protein